MTQCKSCRLLDAATDVLLPLEKADDAEKYFQLGSHNFSTLGRNFLENNQPFIFKNSIKHHIQESVEIKSRKILLEEVSEKSAGTTFRLWMGTTSSPPPLKEKGICQLLTGCSEAADITAAHPDLSPGSLGAKPPGSDGVQFPMSGPQGQRWAEASCAHFSVTFTHTLPRAAVLQPQPSVWMPISVSPAQGCHTCLSTYWAQAGEEGDAHAREALHPSTWDLSLTGFEGRRTKNGKRGPLSETHSDLF